MCAHHKVSQYPARPAGACPRARARAARKDGRRRLRQERETDWLVAGRERGRGGRLCLWLPWFCVCVGGGGYVVAVVGRNERGRGKVKQRMWCVCVRVNTLYCVAVPKRRPKGTAVVAPHRVCMCVCVCTKNRGLWMDDGGWVRVAEKMRRRQHVGAAPRRGNSSEKRRK